MSSRAPKVCNELGCTALVYDGRRRCDVHYNPWGGKGFDKRRTDTEEHRRLRSRVLGRAGYRCQIRYEDICIRRATEVDRVDNTKDYHDHNCQAACVPCHRRKTSYEGHDAKGHQTPGTAHA